MSVPVSIAFADVPAEAGAVHTTHGKVDYALSHTQFVRELRAFEMLGSDAASAVLSHDFHYGDGTVYVHTDVFAKLESAFTTYNDKRVADVKKQIAGYDAKIVGHNAWINGGPVVDFVKDADGNMVEKIVTLEPHLEEYAEMVRLALAKRENKEKSTPMTPEERVESLKKSRELKSQDKYRPTLTVVGSKPKGKKNDDGVVVPPTEEELKNAYRTVTNSENSKNKFQAQLDKLEKLIAANNVFDVAFTTQNFTVKENGVEKVVARNVTLAVDFKNDVRVKFVSQTSAELKRFKTTTSTLGMRFVDPYSFVCFVSSHTVQRPSPKKKDSAVTTETKVPGDTSSAEQALRNVILTQRFVESTPLSKARDMKDKVVDICKRIMENNGQTIPKDNPPSDVARHRVETVVGEGAEAAWNALVAKAYEYSNFVKKLRASGVISKEPKVVKKPRKLVAEGAVDVDADAAE